MLNAPARLRLIADGKIFFAISRPFTVVPGCTADFDDGSGTGARDAAVTVDDLLYYLTMFADGTPLADIDDGTGTGVLDSAVTIDDLIYYLVRFEAGC